MELSKVRIGFQRTKRKSIPCGGYAGRHGAPLSSPLFFIANVAAGGGARLAMGEAMHVGGDSLVYYAIAGSLPVAVALLALAQYRPHAALGDALATGLGFFGVLAFYRKPPNHSRFMTQWSQPE